MNKLSIFIYGFLLSFCGMTRSLGGEIIEANEIQAMIPSINPDSFVFLNVDGTLYAPSNTLSDHQWRDYFSSRVKEIVDDWEMAQGLIDRVNNQIASDIPKKVVQELIPPLIACLQDKRIVVFGINQKQAGVSDANPFQEITHKHLLNLGIQLEKTLDYFPIKEASEEEGDHFAYGMLFTNEESVGSTLLSFLNQQGRRPYHLVMVDPSLESLEDAQQALESTEIVFTGIRYGRTDSLKERFDPTLGIIEFFAFINEGEILSDEEAEILKPQDRSIDYEALLDKYIQQTVELNLQQ